MVRLFPRLTGVPGPAVLTALILKDTHGKGPASEFSVMARGQVGVLPQLRCLLHSSECLCWREGRRAAAMLLDSSTCKAISEVSMTLQGALSAGCFCNSTSVCKHCVWRSLLADSSFRQHQAPPTHVRNLHRGCRGKAVTAARHAVARALG